MLVEHDRSRKTGQQFFRHSIDRCGCSPWHAIPGSSCACAEDSGGEVCLYLRIVETDGNNG